MNLFKNIVWSLVFGAAIFFLVLAADIDKNLVLMIAWAIYFTAAYMWFTRTTWGYSILKLILQNNEN